METALCGQSDIVATINKIISDPPHIFLSGAYGSGKTTLVHEFLKAYYKPHGISYTDPEWTVWLSSEQDRGIHCVRQSVTEFVRHTSAKPGVYRWIVIDDADSFPTISQQALRRPMETHAHTTRFIFVSRHTSDIIQPIRSRCLHLEMDTVSPMILLPFFFAEAGYPGMKIHPSALQILFSLAHTPTELRSVARLAASIFKDPTKAIGPQDLIDLFAAPAFSLCVSLLQSYVNQDRARMMQDFLAIWATGISYEDFLHELTLSVNQIGLLEPRANQEIYQLILKGWISFAQGKTHTLDLMRLFLGS
jgi:DNA polymerase III gamma/tau subunit